MSMLILDVDDFTGCQVSRHPHSGRGQSVPESHYPCLVR